MKKVWTWIFSIFVLIVVLVFAYFFIIKESYIQNDPICGESPLIVERVIDGDTFILCSGDTVRLLCVDTPEEGKEGYEEAKVFLEDLILYKQVSLALSNYDAETTDKYGRLLRWVSIDNPSSSSGEQLLINRYILEEGYGDILIIPPETCNEVSD
ncbi:MAG: thermonuclease family protein [Nanobdellota archaeon]